MHIGIIITLLCTFSLSAYEMVDLARYNPNIVVDLRYGCNKNFYEQKFYPSEQIFVDQDVARRLGRVQRELAKQGIGLIVYEGYRPPSIQTALDLARQRRHPEQYYFDDEPHYRKGLGVDVGIYYLDGSPMNLPTPWGVDCAEAYRDYPYHVAHVYHNSALLEDVMCRNGFSPLRERWWHFDLHGSEHLPALALEYSIPEN